MQYIQLGNISIEVEKKEIKNVHLSVYPPDGAVHISAPNRMDLDTIRVFAINKLQWIKQQQASFRNQARETPREFLTKESHYLFGKRYLLQITEHQYPPKVVLRHNTIELFIKPNTDTPKRNAIVNEWYRTELRNTVTPMVQKWEQKIGVQSNEVRIKRMRTKWGSCNIEAKRIWLNLELAKKPKNCIEFIICHELVHLLERNHNSRFVAYMNEFMPNWRENREELNRLPFCHLNWKY